RDSLVMRFLRRQLPRWSRRPGFDLGILDWRCRIRCRLAMAGRSFGDRWPDDPFPSSVRKNPYTGNKSPGRRSTHVSAGNPRTVAALLLDRLRRARESERASLINGLALQPGVLMLRSAGYEG